MKRPHACPARRRLLGVAMAALLLTAGCTPAAPAATEAFYLNVANQCSDAVMAIHYEYALAGQPVGGGDVQNSEGQPLSRGETLSLDFTPQHFPEGADLSSFTVQLSVVLDDGAEHPVGGPIALAASYGQSYAYGLTGNRNVGFAWTAG